MGIRLFNILTVGDNQSNATYLYIQISKLMGQYMLKGYRMLDSMCPVSGSIFYFDPRLGLLTNTVSRHEVINTIIK